MQSSTAGRSPKRLLHMSAAAPRAALGELLWSALLRRLHLEGSLAAKARVPPVPGGGVQDDAQRGP